jgi:class 3 adenylate cyclase
VDVPDVSYARSGDVAIAYQVVGEGPTDLVFVRVGGKLGGIAIPTGARIASLAEPGEVLVSSTVKDLVAGSGLSFEDRGTHELKGVPGEWRLYAVNSA